MVAPFDHVRVRRRDDEQRLSPGTYRVVGADDERVTLLEVADESGARVHTGRLERVPHETLDGLESVDSPDPTGALVRVRNQFGGLALTLRFAPRRLARRPLQTLVGVVLVVVEAVGPSVAPGAPESVLTVAGVLGVFALVAAALDLP